MRPIGFLSLVLLLVLAAACPGKRATRRVDPGLEPAVDPHGEVSACVAEVGDLMGQASMLSIGGYLGRALLLAETAVKRCEAPETFDALARILAELGLDARALEAYRRFLELEPHEHHKGEVRELVEAVAKRPGPSRPNASEEEKREAQLLYRHGASLRVAGKYDRAIQRLRQSYRLWPHPVTIAQISLAHRAAGREVQARKTSDRALAIAELLTGEKAVAKLLLDHSDRLREIAWSPNGKLMASLARDRTLKVWHVPTGRVLETVTLVEPANSVQFLGNDAVLFGGGPMGALMVFELGSRELRKPPLPPPGMLAVAADREGKRFAYVGRKGSRLGVRTLAGSKILWESLTAMPWRAQQVSFDSAGQSLLVAGARVLVLDAKTGAQRYELPRYSKRDNLAVFSSDGALIAVGGGTRLSVHDARTGKLKRRLLPGFSVQALVFSPDGSQLFSGGGQDIVLWDLASGAERSRYRHPERGISGLALAPDGGTLAVSGGSSVIHLLDAETGTPVRTLGSLTGRRTAVAVSAVGHRMVTGSGDGELILWRLDRVTSPQRLRHGRVAITAVVLDRRGRRMVSIDERRVAVLWDARSGRRIATLKGALSAAFTATGAELLLGGEGGAITVHDSRTGTELRRLARGGRHDVLGIDVSAHRDEVVVATTHGFRVQSLSTGAGVYEIEGLGRLGIARYTPKGDRLVAGPIGYGWGLFDAHQPSEPIVERAAHQGAYALAFSSDGTNMVSAGWRDRDLVVWGLETWRSRKILQGHLGAVHGLAFDKHVLVSASSDKTLRLWDAAQGSALGVVHVGPAGDWVVLSADGRVDGTQGQRSQQRIFWQVGDIVLPGFVGWNRAQTPGLLLELMGRR